MDVRPHIYKELITASGGEMNSNALSSGSKMCAVVLVMALMLLPCYQTFSLAAEGAAGAGAATTTGAGSTAAAAGTGAAAGMTTATIAGIAAAVIVAAVALALAEDEATTAEHAAAHSH